jgi:hypothetical protein
MPKHEEENRNDGTIPDGTINQVCEYTLGGFILFYFNSQTGEPEQIMTFDSPAHNLALRKYIADWTKAVDKFELDNSVFNIQQSVIDTLEDEEGEE